MRRPVSPGRRRRWLALAMASFSAVGLFSGPVPDHIAVYSGLEDVFAFSLEAPLEFAPGTVGRYRNIDTLVLGAIIRRTVEAVGESYHHWPQRMLFDALGTDDFVLETDASGHFVLSGYLYGTAEAWARLALLFLRGGVVDDQRLMPESFVDFVRTPGAAWPGAEFGGQFWLDADERCGLPEDAYCMLGSGGQMACIVPSYDAVLVRFGHINRRRAGPDPPRSWVEIVNAHLARAVSPTPE